MSFSSRNFLKSLGAFIGFALMFTFIFNIYFGLAIGLFLSIVLFYEPKKYAAAKKRFEKKQHQNEDNALADSIEEQ